MKAYTDLEQSKKLAEILPIGSADMYYEYIGIPVVNVGTPNYNEYGQIIPCWSIGALLGVLNKSAYFVNEAGIVELSSIKTTKWCVNILNCGKIENCYADEPVDACYEMILKLHELNLL